MKHPLAVLALFCIASSVAHADTTLAWMTGAYDSNRLVIDGATTTAATFNPFYELRLMQLGYKDNYTYTDEKGYSVFILVGTNAVHYTGTDSAGKISGTIDIPDDPALKNLQYIMAIYEKTSGKYFFVSESVAGQGIAPGTLPLLDPFTNPPLEYFPTSSTGYFHKGAEIPPFCGWLAGKGLTQASLTGLNTNAVNTAFAVNANPTNFSRVAASITATDFAADSISGAFSFKSFDSSNNPTTVTNLNGTAALSLRSSTSLTGAEGNAPATFNLSSGTFQSSSGATGETQFLRLRLSVPEVW